MSGRQRIDAWAVKRGGLLRGALLALLWAAGPATTLGPVLAAAAGQGTPAGFTALFNGRDLSGWQGLVGGPPERAKLSPEELRSRQQQADETMRAHWKVVDGVIVFDGAGDSLCTQREFEDFELIVDWQIGAQGDSGIYLRGCPQVQIWDNPEGSGGLWNNKKFAARPLIVADRPVGEWNRFRIRMVGERVTVYLNDLLVTDDVPLENYWERDKPVYARGPIELQSHKTPLKFRNIFIRELPRKPPPPAPVLKRGDRVAVVGDSITEQKQYSRFIEDYLLACVPQLELSCVQLGWSGERAPGFAERLEHDLLPLKPTVVTTCYGMNDGSYRAYEPAIGATYAKALRDIVTRLRQAGVTVVVGAPGAVDLDTFRRPDLPADVYNANLAQLRDLARERAWEESQPFANAHDHLMVAMRKAKPVLGPAYHVCGGDGIHPAPNGHLVMAYAFLKALGLDGEIGTVTVDLAAGGTTATATDGHNVLSAAAGAVELESTRYPFCFYGEPNSPTATRSILPFVPFNADLNRLTLVVRNLPTPAATVTWGETRRFTREQLEAGVNLAAEFLDNPFSEPFRQLDELVARKQAFETALVKECFASFRRIRSLAPDDPAVEEAIATLRTKLLAAQERWQADARAAVKPVRHTLVIQPAE